jgi:UDP-3-O-[3-hydroxymyristoyl] N-acetylglucosamine deacetylase
MSAYIQKTVANPITINGIGLHSGQKVQIKICPSGPNTGIIFKRTDIKNNNYVNPNLFNVSNATLCTKITNEFGVSVSTIEHLMGALFGEGIDNCLVETSAEELPILDGSAKEFVKKINEVGVKLNNAPIKIIKLEKKVNFLDGNKSISIEPSKEGLEIDFTLKYKNSLIGNQRNSIKVYEDNLEDIYNSRTFCLYEDIEKVKKMGLGKGGSLNNAIVVKNNQILNDEGLRNKKEFVNHKILDCIGDLYLSGYKILGKVICSEGGHKLTNQLLRKVFSEKSNFSLVEIKEKNIPHTFIYKNSLEAIA